jgi:Xaa-Pro aminopeptidase
VAATDVREGQTLGVGDATREYRAGLMRELMEREQLDALAFTTPDYVKFATNFSADVSGFERPGVAVIPREGEPFIVLHELSQNNWRFSDEGGRLWIGDASFYSEHPRVRNRLPLITQWNELVAERLDGAGLARGRIGTDGGTLAGVCGQLPHLEVEDVELKCRRLRWVKCQEELELMRHSAAFADWGMELYREQIRPGRVVTELDMTIGALIADEAAQRMPGTDVGLFLMTLSGPVSASPHGAGAALGNLAGATIEEGHVLVVCVVLGIDGLYVENERTWFCGDPSPRQVELFEAAREATETGCAAAIAGQPIWSIDAAAQDVFERAGVADLICHRTGHGLGLGCHDFPIDMAFNSSPMVDRMVFSVEPGIYEFGLGGFRHDDTVVVNGDSPEILTKTPKDLDSQTVR